MSIIDFREKKNSLSLEAALQNEKFVNSALRIPIIIGYDEDGELLVENLTRMPHLLVAGSSGSGKSAFLRNVITCIASRFTPDEVKLVLFDLKRTEFDLYAKDYPHSSGVITDIDSAVKTLRYLLDLSRERSKLIAEAGIINALRFEGANAIDEYNSKTGSTLPRIVVIIDEFAELTKSEEVKEVIFELTRCAHGAGIHLVISSQRAASDEVITDRILANILTRACFRISDEYDNFRIIGTAASAEKLSCGQMIYSSIRASSIVKVPYVSYERSLKLAKGKRNENRF